MRNGTTLVDCETHAVKKRRSASFSGSNPTFPPAKIWEQGEQPLTKHHVSQKPKQTIVRIVHVSVTNQFISSG